MEPIPDDTRLHGAFRYVSHDEDTGDKLYNREIQDALAGLAQNAKIDVIGFDACLMSMLETAYALRDHGAVMVASEELEPGDGWSYDNFLKPLVADPAGTDAAGLGSLMVAGYREYYGDRDATTLSAVDLSKPTALAEALSRFATTAIRNLDTHLPAIKRARKACENYAPGYGLNSIDLGRFLDQVASSARGRRHAGQEGVGRRGSAGGHSDRQLRLDPAAGGFRLRRAWPSTSRSLGWSSTTTPTTTATTRKHPLPRRVRRQAEVVELHALLLGAGWLTDTACAGAA